MSERDKRIIFPKKCLGCGNVNLVIPGFCKLDKCMPQYDDFSRAYHEFHLKNRLKDVIKLGD